MTKKTLGWNPTYFGEPKKGSLAATIADITSKQNDQVGGKPVVQDSVAVQAQKEKEQLAKEGKMMKATHKPTMKDDENTAKDMRDKNKKDAKGEEKPIKVHGEQAAKDFEEAKPFKVQSMIDALKKVYGEAAKQRDELTDKQKKLPPALQKAIKAKEKNEDLEKDDEKDVKDVIKGLKKAQGLHKKQADNLAKQIKDDKKEAAKPDFLDLDKDGNKTEPMKKAAKDKEKK